MNAVLEQKQIAAPPLQIIGTVKYIGPQRIDKIGHLFQEIHVDTVQHGGHTHPVAVLIYRNAVNSLQIGETVAIDVTIHALKHHRTGKLMNQVIGYRLKYIK